ncbi:YitT family protein [Clostridium sp. MSJ-4]|uniref:YitT family protein n=1 Tax=Clostridium simiarum TaxID=2841506 RepID=A0ABS6EZ61_9CLOT|nr:YitT family protein [Clostridium simiarum]MBU5591508.1 YitT family protein [Clostridium simiarum]
MGRKVRDFIVINLGIAMVALGMYFFLMPNNLATGGANGLAIVINSFIPALSVGILMIIINLVLFIVAFLAIGKNFGIKTIYSSLGVSFMILILEKIIPIQKSITGELFLELIFGIIISGGGMAIVFNENASTGGTDIIAKILNKFFHINLGKAVLLADLSITVMAGFAFGPRLSMFSMLGVIINGFIIDSIIEGLNMNKQVTIISSKYEEVRKYIIEELEKSSTIYEAIGGFSDENKKVIVSIMGRREFIRLKNFINTIDQDAFVTVNNIYEVFGNGFGSFTH